MEKPAGKRKAMHGFSLVEFLVAMAVFALLTTMFCLHFSRHMTSFSREKNRIDTQQRLRAVLGWLEEDIRLAGFDPLGLSSAVGIEIAEPGHFAFSYRVDQDGDGIWSEEDWKRIDYYTESDKRLRRRERNTPESSGSTSIILDNAVVNFVYLDQNHTILQNAQGSENIRAIRVELGAELDHAYPSQSSITFATTVHCRNLGGRP